MSNKKSLQGFYYYVHYAEYHKSTVFEFCCSNITHFKLSFNENFELHVGAFDYILVLAGAAAIPVIFPFLGSVELNLSLSLTSRISAGLDGNNHLLVQLGSGQLHSLKKRERIQVVWGSAVDPDPGIRNHFSSGSPDSRRGKFKNTNVNNAWKMGPYLITVILIK